MTYLKSSKSKHLPVGAKGEFLGLILRILNQAEEEGKTGKETID